METRMRRWVLAGTLGASCALYFSLQEPGTQVAQQPSSHEGLELTEGVEPKTLTVDDTVLAMLPMLERPDMEGRLSALEAIGDALDGEGGKLLSDDVREQAAKSVITAFETSPEDSVEGQTAKAQALRLVIGRLGGEAGKAFTLEVLSSATDTWKVEALQAWLKPGAASGASIREKVAELARTELVPDSFKPRMLRRALGKKAEPEIIALLTNGAADRGTIAACVVELQNFGKPEVMGQVLSRLEEAGMLDDHKKMPWISGKLLAQHIRVSDEDGLKRALKAVYLRPSLTRPTVKAIQERASHPNASVRRMVARIIPDAVKNEGLDVTSGEELLLARLKEETDPTVKGEIEGSLAEVRKTRPPTEASPSIPVEP